VLASHLLHFAPFPKWQLQQLQQLQQRFKCIVRVSWPLLLHPVLFAAVLKCKLRALLTLPLQQQQQTLKGVCCGLDLDGSYTHI